MPTLVYENDIGETKKRASVVMACFFGHFTNGFFPAEYTGFGGVTWRYQGYA